MDGFIQELMASGPLGVVASALVYLIIHIQRRNSTESRNKEISKLTSDIAELYKEKELVQKDISYLMNENTTIKEDLKEIKNTLNTMALALERIAAKYDEK